jgi:23S rRNA (pseudouridine1915-N3)-methyltransferase
MIFKKIPQGSFVCALCVEGKALSSEDLAERVKELSSRGTNITFIIGSSYGLSDTVKKSADLRLSMSEMTFPHQLARVMLLEQIYRAFQISSGGKYHK